VGSEIGVRHLYTMSFVFPQNLKGVLLLRKPNTHPNPLLRGRLTGPGGLVEIGETELEGAVRELREETSLAVEASAFRFVLRFACNCDPSEAEHDVAVYGLTVPMEELLRAHGNPIEPVDLFSHLPENAVWYLEPMLALVVGRLGQPSGAELIK
jgi:ADP-ribose pyrophosphatase YjhB (NUDIX family)